MALKNITEEQKIYILNNWEQESYSMIGKKIGLSDKEVSHFCVNRGLRKRSYKRIGSKENLLTVTYPQVAKEWNYELNKDVNLHKVTYGSGLKVWWNCPIGHDPYPAAIQHRTLSNSGCPTCARQYKSSFPEQAIYFYIKKVFKDALSAHTFSEIEFLEGDIYIPSLKLVIEYDGERYHKNKVEKDEIKNRLFNENGLKLIRVREPKLPKLKEHGSIAIDRKNVKSYSSLDEVICKVLQQILILYKNKLSKIQKEKLKKTIQSVNVSKDKGYVIQNLKFKLIKNSVFECFPELMDEWNEPLIDPKTISKHNDLPIQWKCRTCQHEWTAVLKSRTGKVKAGCPKCSGNEKYTYEEVIEKFEEKKYILLSKEYKNSQSYLFYKCSEHLDIGIQKVKFGEFIQSQNPCKRCRFELLSKNMIKYNINDIHKEFKERGFELRSKKFLGVREKLEFVCSKHKKSGVQTVEYSNFKNIITPCKPCSRENAKITGTENKRIKDNAKKMGYVDVNLIRRSKKTYFEFICSKHMELGKQEIVREEALKNKPFCKICLNQTNK